MPLREWPARHEGKSAMTVLTWTDDRVEQLKKLWEAGLSASQIAAELGNVTRNAVIGKVHRLGLSGRAKGPSSAAPRQRKARPAQQMMRVSRPVSRGNTALAHAFDMEMEPDPIAYDNVVPMSQRLSLLELNEATCHWPIGDPSSSEFFFCGGKALSSLPYCAHHSRIAYQPASDRRRQPPKPTRSGADIKDVVQANAGRRTILIATPPSQSDHPARSRRPARCGSDPARRPG